MFFQGVAVTLLAAASASQTACVVRAEPRPVRPMRYHVRRGTRRGERVLLLPRNIMPGDELVFENGTVAVVRRVHRDRVAVTRGHRTVILRAEFY